MSKNSNKVNNAWNGEMQDLMKIGAEVQVKNGGHHWIISYGQMRVDYWPSSERFQVTYKTQIRRGFKDMVRLIQGEESKS